MDLLEYQPLYPVSDRPSPIFFIAAALAALSGVAALGVGVYNLITSLHRSGSSIGWPGASMAIVGGAGVLLVEALAMTRKSEELTSVIGTLFGAAPFIVLPAIVEKFLYIMSIPGIRQASTWSQVGAFAALGVFCGFIGFAHFAEMRRIHSYRAMREELDEPGAEAPASLVIPPLPETAP
jgi:hypothetical protein